MLLTRPAALASAWCPECAAIVYVADVEEPDWEHVLAGDRLPHVASWPTRYELTHLGPVGACGAVGEHRWTLPSDGTVTVRYVPVLGVLDRLQDRR